MAAHTLGMLRGLCLVDPVTTKLLRIENLCFAYPGSQQHRPVLNGVSLTMAEGEKVALLGPNGAGKSTLLLHLNGLHLGSGQVQVGPYSVERSTLAQVREMVGLVFQNPDDQLFCPTVAEDVGYGPRCQGVKGEALARAVRRALGAVGLEGTEERFPQHLSEGEKKRVALATVLSMNPSLLALDEPTAGLDARARRAVIEVLRHLPQAMLIATHDLELARELTERAVLLEQGSVMYDGPTAHALDDRAILERYGLIA